MCGIVGIYYKNGASRSTLDQCSSYFASNLHHRGPDAFGAYRGEQCIFANLRLAIVDRAGGDQPIYAPERKQGIVYNGEVYNWHAIREPLEKLGYPFTTNSDTECVLAAFLSNGTSSFAELNGMFALCIWDELTSSFTLARDRFGTKPLYLYEDDNVFAFASEIKTLLGFPGLDLTLNPLAFQDYLTYRFTHAPYTFFKHINKLPAGCFLRFDGNKSVIERFAEVSLHEPEHPLKAETYIEELDHILENAVRSQLMGEVPIGVLLSGGLDSSTIACYLQRAGAKLKAYNIGFPEINEFTYARDVAQYFDLEYMEICMTQEELVAGMDATILRLDEPMADPACFALSRLCEDIRKDVTVVLSGEGSDEMFAGYGQHLFALDPNLDRNRCFDHFFTYSANYGDAVNWLKDKKLPPENLRYKISVYDPSDTVLNGMQNFELHTWLPENLMMKADKVLMAHSLEGRFPFLDLELYRFASRLPQAMKLPSQNSSKHVLRTLMADKLPESIITRRKMGFSVPPSFFLQRLSGRFKEALDLLRGQPVADILDLNAISQLANAYYAGQQDIPLFKVWNIFVLVYWFAYAYPAFKSGRHFTELPLFIQNDTNSDKSLKEKDHDELVLPEQVSLNKSKSESGGKPARLVIYTVIIGDKEQIGNPLTGLSAASTSDLDLDFVCFTDNHILKSDVWRFEYIDAGYLPAEKLSRRPKTMPHKYLPDCHYSLYIDNTVAFKRLPHSNDLQTSHPYLFKTFRHGTRNSLSEEADAIAMLGYDDVNILHNQLDFYSSLRPLDSITPLTTCTVMLRSHNHPKIVEFGEIWWEQILNFSKRDQMSFDFSAIHTGCEVEYFIGTTQKNDIIIWPAPSITRRVLANFDSARYSWINRHDPEANSNPRKHFLLHGNGNGSEYSRPLHLFEYICYKQKSSLGSFVSPRRSVAVPLGEILLPYREKSGNLLIVRIREDNLPRRFLDAELESASSALAMMLNKYKPQTLDLLSRDLCQTSVVYANSAVQYDIVVVLGLPSERMLELFDKFVRIINPSQGLFAIVTTGESNLGNIQDIKNQLASPQFNVKADASVSFSHHDDLALPVNNSMVCFQWGSQIQQR
jgi:asparagine synthase (glutamine-hydrolysing)